MEGEEKQTFSRLNSRCILVTLAVTSLLCLIVTIALVIVATRGHSSSGSIYDEDYSSDICTTKGCVAVANSLIQSMDPTVDPCEDFFEYACGTWLTKNILPAHKSAISVLHLMVENVHGAVKNILEDEKSSAFPLEDVAKTLYKSCIDEATVEKRGNVDLLMYLESLGGMPLLETKEGGGWSPEDFNFEVLLANARKDTDKTPILSIDVREDNKIPDENILYISQGIFGMPDRSFLLKGVDDPVVQSYENYMLGVAQILGTNASVAASGVRDVLEFEIQLANFSLPNEQRNPVSMYNRMNLSNVQSLFAEFKWMDFFVYIFNETTSKQSIDFTDEVVIETPDYIDKMLKLVKDVPERKGFYFMTLPSSTDVVIECFSLFSYWNHLPEKIDVLPQTFQDLKARYDKAVRGTTTQVPRWRTCASYVNTNMPLLVGHVYVKNEMRNKAKDVVLDMVEDLKSTMAGLIEDSDWMDSVTKSKAINKASKIDPRMGYSDTVMNQTFLEEMYSSYRFEQDKLFSNDIFRRKLQMYERLRKYKTKVDPKSFDLPPAFVNAVYNPAKNQITFPAGILQPPLFHSDYPKYINYAGIGSVIGHEITHGFDQRGRSFDEFGRLRQWWSAESHSAFDAKLPCMIEQYSNFTVDEANLNLNGRLTLGENIADNGGLKESFKAYKKWEGRNKREQVLPGLNLNNDQVFFLMAAHVWCGAYRPEEAVKRIYSDYHSHFRYRVIGPFQNNEDFARVFRCPVDSRMNPLNKCAVW